MPSKVKRSRIFGFSFVLLGLLFLPELIYYLASRTADIPDAYGRCRVLVLGYPPNADGSPSRVQRYRVRVGWETFRKYHCASMILSGGNPHSTLAEADVMARIALEQGMSRENLFLERRARNTWENVKYSLEAMKDKEHVFIASDALHALRARRYLCRQRFELCPKAHVATRYESFHFFGYKWIAAWYALKSVMRDWLMLKFYGRIE